MKSGVFLVAFCARLKTYGAFFGDKNHKAFSRFCLCGHEKSGLASWGYCQGDFCYGDESLTDVIGLNPSIHN